VTVIAVEMASHREQQALQVSAQMSDGSPTNSGVAGAARATPGIRVQAELVVIGSFASCRALSRAVSRIGAFEIDCRSIPGSVADCSHAPSAKQLSFNLRVCGHSVENRPVHQGVLASQRCWPLPLTE